MYLTELAKKFKLQLICSTAHRLEDHRRRVEAEHRGRTPHLAVHRAPRLERRGRERGGRRRGDRVLHRLQCVRVGLGLGLG